MNIFLIMIMEMGKILMTLGTMFFEFMDIPYHKIIYSTGKIINTHYT